MVSRKRPTAAAKLRARIKHPVIDADGHVVEITPVIADYIREIAGEKMAQRFLKDRDSGRLWAGWKTMSDSQRAQTRTPASSWWGFPTNTLDRATAALAKLQHERMDDLGIDFAVLYPTEGLSTLLLPDAELRQVASRALNHYFADQYKPYGDRLAPTAIIPMHTPKEAVAELEHAVKKLGMKAIAIMGQVHRPIPKVLKERPDLAGFARYLDVLAIDGDHDYDPFWAKCVELKVSVGVHGSGQGWGSRRSTSRYVYNHVGAFAAAGEAFCKALVMGGVPHRFPKLQFAFLEGGAAWACELYAGLIGHWKKRGGKSIRKLNPSAMDLKKMMALYSTYGDKRIQARLAEIREDYARKEYQPKELDDFALAGIRSAEDFRKIFERQFYFGCEADDPLNAWAFNREVNPYKARLRPILGSDIGHWDVEDMTGVLPEAYELVEHELISEADFRAFTFENARDLYLKGNPSFFKGTVLQDKLR